MEGLNIIPRYGGLITHDCWASYLSYDHCGHGLCESHLLRELTFIVDSNQYRWARNTKKLLTQDGPYRDHARKKCLTAQKYANLQKRYCTILTRGGWELAEIPAKPKGKPGRLAISYTLWESLKKHQTSILLLAKKRYVPFTNNRAES